MTNRTADPFSSAATSRPAFSLSTTPSQALSTTASQALSTTASQALHNSTSLGFPSTTPQLDLLDQIAANDLTSRANYVYALCAGLGLLSACFLLYSFVQTYRAQRRVAWLDGVLWAFCGSQLLLLLLSLSSVAHRPGYLKAAPLGCAALSFTVSVSSLCGLLLLVLMGYVLTFDPPSHALLKRSGVCIALVALASVLVSLLLAGLCGLPSPGFQGLEGEEDTSCVIDPVQAGLSYTVAKLCLGFLVPYALLLALMIGGCVHQWKSSGRFLSGSEEGPVFLAAAAALFACNLFYGVALVRGAGLEERGRLSHHERALMSVAEFVLFSGSCLSLVLVLLVHRPCRESLQGVGRQLRDCCRGLSGTQTQRHIIAPRIEITDTLQDYEP